MIQSLQLLGVPKLEQQGQNIAIPLDKPASMLFYLAQRADWVSRSELGFLYRPDAPEQIALSNVRNYIYRAKNYPWANTLEVTKARIRYQINTDVQAFNTAFKEANWQQALKLYKGTFLKGISLQDAPSLETWLELERQDLSQKWRMAALRHSHKLENNQDYVNAETWLEKVLKADPLDEEALQAYLRVLFLSGKRSQASDTFESFQKKLKQDLDVEPLETTKTLFESLGQLEPKHFKTAKTKPRHNLPAQTTRFIGRKQELERLTKTLAKPDCRLLTLIGLGGAGKTRLGLELAATQLEHYQGVYFVPLAGVNSADLLASTIAASIGLGLSGKNDPKEQLAQFISDKEMLLLIDNFEHLVEGALLIEELLSAAPKLKIIITSRIALELTGEWLFDLSGLSYPPEATNEALSSFDAIQLFNNRAERVSASFTAEKESLEAVAELSRKVEGLPLALELAATWTRSLSVPQLLTELDKSFDLLSSQHKDLSERHRSIKNVFDYSWQRLSQKEQDALAKLSVFQGGFTLEAAEQVAHAHLALLLSLINHSLVQRKQGRFDLHEFVRQYAAEKLDQRAEHHDLCEQRFIDYYRDFLLSQKVALKGESQKEALDLIAQDIGNVRSVWRFLVKAEEQESIFQLAPVFFNYFDIRANYEEGYSLFATTAKTFLEKGKYRGALLTGQGTFAWRKDNYREAKRILEEALTCSLDSRWQATALISLSNVENSLGNPLEAEKHLELALAVSSKANDKQSMATSYNGLAIFAAHKGDVARSVKLFRENLELCISLGNKVARARAMRNLANTIAGSVNGKEAEDLFIGSLKLSKSLGDLRGEMMSSNGLGFFYLNRAKPKEARYYFELSLSISETIADRHSIALAKNLLSETARYEEDYLTAQQLEEESLAVRRELGDKSGVAFSLDNLGQIADKQARHYEAEVYLLEALELRRSLNQKKTMIASLCNLAKVRINLESFENARNHLNEALHLTQEYIANQTTDLGALSEVLLTFAILFAKQDNKIEASELLLAIKSEATYNPKGHQRVDDLLNSLHLDNYLLEEIKESVKHKNLSVLAESLLA